MSSAATETNLLYKTSELENFKSQEAVYDYSLAVEKSILGKEWILNKADDRLAQGITQKFGLPEIVSRILASRDIGYNDVETFLNPSIKDQLPDPYVLKDMQKAAERIVLAIENGEKIAVFGDYDVDGATSSALLKKFFAALNLDIRLYIPDRIEEGYGPNAAAMLNLKEEGMDLVITVDCGITSFEPLDAAVKAGIDIVILDHHRADVQIPAVTAAVNPNRLDDESGLGHMAAVGVVFLAIIAVNRLLREKGYYSSKGISEPRILQWLDLVALGTICDVVSLTGINRAFAAQGLKVMAMRQNKGLKALADVAAVSEAPSAFHAGYLLGPRVNAGGRVGEAGLGAWLLATDDEIEAKTIALQLNQYNIERRDLEKQVLEQAIEIIEAKPSDNKVIVVSGEGWHAGVIGIVASRLKEKYNKPVCVIAFDENNIGKASARSVSGVDLGASIISAKQQGLLVAGGGHKMAAGFTIVKENLAQFIAYINSHVSEQLNGEDYKPRLHIDGILSVSSLNMMLAEKLESLAPFGQGNFEPRFTLKGVKIAKPRVVGENHISCFIQDSAGGSSVKAIAFRALDNAMGEVLLKSNIPLDIAGQISINEWNGNRSVSFQIVDIANSNF